MEHELGVAVGKGEVEEAEIVRALIVSMIFHWAKLNVIIVSEQITELQDKGNILPSGMGESFVIFTVPSIVGPACD